MAEPGQRLSEALGSKELCIVDSKGKGERSEHDFYYIYISNEKVEDITQVLVCRYLANTSSEEAFLLGTSAREGGSKRGNNSFLLIGMLTFETRPREERLVDLDTISADVNQSRPTRSFHPSIAPPRACSCPSGVSTPPDPTPAHGQRFPPASQLAGSFPRPVGDRHVGLDL